MVKADRVQLVVNSTLGTEAAALPDGKTRLPSETTVRGVLGACFCILLIGAQYGFSALYPIFIDAGLLSGYCDGNEAEKSCAEQVSSLREFN